jgi:hypothetical protein
MLGPSFLQVLCWICLGRPAEFRLVVTLIPIYDDLRFTVSMHE